jgi:hypothetical protein
LPQPAHPAKPQVTALRRVLKQYRARYLEAAGTKNTTAARKLTAVSSFYGWCARRGHLTASPFVSLDRPVVDYDTSATPGLTGDQATALLEAADTDRGPQAARTAALKVGRRWTAEEESVARSAFAGAFGKAPAFGGGFDEPASLARERRAFENAAIEAALDYRNVVCGMDTAAGDHTAGKITVEEFIERSVHAHTDSISARVDADIARNAKTLKISAITEVSSARDLVDHHTDRWLQHLGRRCREPGHSRWVHLCLLHLQPVRP